MQNTIRGAVAAAALSFMLAGTGAASAIPEPGPFRPANHVPAARPDCPLERIDTQLVRCDDLTGADVSAPAYIPVQDAS